MLDATMMINGQSIQSDNKVGVINPSDDIKLNNGRILSGGEQFGPIMPIIKYTDLDEVIARVNCSKSGLGGSVWSSDTQKSVEMAQQLDAGTVWINEHGVLQSNAPFGGVK